MKWLRFLFLVLIICAMKTIFNSAVLEGILNFVFVLSVCFFCGYILGLIYTLFYMDGYLDAKEDFNKSCESSIMKSST